MKALLAGGQIEIGARFGDHAIHNAQDLASAADGELLDRRKPRLLDEILQQLVTGLRAPEAAIHLVEQPELALEKEFDQRDTTVIEMREIDTRIEHALAGIFGVIDEAAPEHSDLDLLVEQDQIHRRLQRGDRDIVLRIQELSVGERDFADGSLARGRSRAEIDKTAPPEFGEPVLRVALGPQHCVDHVKTALRIGENVRHEQTLVDLAPLFPGLALQRALLIDVPPRRRQAGIFLRPPRRPTRTPADAACGSRSAAHTCLLRTARRTPAARRAPPAARPARCCVPAHPGFRPRRSPQSAARPRRNRRQRLGHRRRMSNRMSEWK
ncbi:MAG: hypothetical protein M5U33_12570 [Pseudorhodoplanes sp.]|nr:hypothetical protein [Pseudorhodoplanes sp.]